MASRTNWKKRLHFWKWNKVQPVTDDFERKKETDMEPFRLLDLSWEAWRHGQKIEQDVQTPTTFYRGCAISEELEKHVLHKG